MFPSPEERPLKGALTRIYYFFPSTDDTVQNNSSNIERKICFRHADRDVVGVHGVGIGHHFLHKRGAVVLIGVFTVNPELSASRPRKEPVFMTAFRADFSAEDRKELRRKRRYYPGLREPSA